MIHDSLNNDWLIIANGASLSTNKLRHLAMSKKIMVLDGAYEQVYRLGLPIDRLLGDFDSITPQLLQQAKSDHVTILPRPDQRYTDLEKGLIYLLENNASSIQIAAATGLRLDHTLYNLRLLKKFHHAHCNIQLITETEIVQYLEDTSLVIHGEIDSSIAFLAFTKAYITSRGLKYEVSDYLLEFAAQESISNALAAPTAHITIDGHALIIQSM